ncbi:unnamed protein product [Mucor hiemalis]
MAEAFLGLKVSVLLHSGMKLEGEVSQIEPLNQQMTLKDVTLFFFGQPPHHTPTYGVFGKDVKNLQVLSASNSNNVPPQQPQRASTVSTTTTSTVNHLDNHVLEQVPPPQVVQQKVLSPTKSLSKNRKPKQSNQQQYVFNRNNNNNNGVNNKRNGNDGWAGEDVDIFREEEFDFQKNLNMFDKAKIFAEIRESDETAPEELLVSLNRLPQKKVNLLPTENVLDLQKTAYNEEKDEIDENDFGDESDNDSQTPDEYARRRRKSTTPRSKQIVESLKATKIVTKSSGILCPSVSPLQMAHVEHECTKALDSFGELAIENGGRGSSLLVLQLLNQMDVVSPSVVILVGNNKNGALGLVASRHLINHGCMVTVCIAANQENLCNAIKKYEAVARSFGVITCYSINDLGEADLIVDSILGADEKLLDIPDRPTYEIVCKTIDWANKQDKPILSIDFPSGIDAGTGVPHHSEYVIHPKWTLCLAAPKNGCKSARITGELFLIDIGVPRLCWKRVGIKGNTMPWGADFLVALEYENS